MLPEETNRPDDARPTKDPEAVRSPAGGRVLAGVFLSWLGVLISFLLVRKDAGFLSRICHAGTGCDAVLSSRYSTIRGIPLSWLGLAFYLTIFGLLLVTLSSSAKDRRVMVWNLALWLSVVGVTFSAALMYLQFGVLHAFCPLCTGSAIVIAALVAVLAKEESVHAEPGGGSRAAALALAGMAVSSGVVLFLSGGKPNGEVVAMVDGQTFTRTQMDEELAASLQPLARDRYALESGWIRGKVDTALLASEARRLGTSPEKLLADRMGRDPVITEEAIAAHLAKAGLSATAENTAAAQQQLLTEWRERTRSQVLLDLALNHQVQVFLRPPTLRSMEIDLSTARVSGPAKAAIQLVIFSDFQCPFCAQLAPIIQRIRTEFPREVMVAFRYFPVEGHPRALPAAIAAECAAEQGAFWEYHDRLFTEGGDLSENRLIALAGKIGLDGEKFRQCLSADRARKVVEASYRNAVDQGLEGAPAVFLNGTRVSGKLDFDHLSGLIKSRLKAGTGIPTATP